MLTSLWDYLVGMCLLAKGSDFVDWSCGTSLIRRWHNFMQLRLSSGLRFTLNSSVLYHSISARVWESAVIRPSAVTSGFFCRTMWSCWSITFIVDIYNMMDFQYFQRPMKHFLQTSCWTVLTWQRYVYTMLIYKGLDIARKVYF